MALRYYLAIKYIKYIVCFAIAGIENNKYSVNYGIDNNLIYSSNVKRELILVIHKFKNLV